MAKTKNQIFGQKIHHVVYFNNFERIIFGYFLTKTHIFAINRHLKVVEGCKFVWGSSNHLSKSCKKNQVSTFLGHPV